MGQARRKARKAEEVHGTLSFAADNPDFGRRLVGPDGTPHRYVNICVDEDLIPRDQREAAVVKAGSTITVITPMAGG